MNIFLVLTRYRNGLQDECLFASSKAAFSYIKRRKHAGSSEILEIPVMGELDHIETVYTISWNDRTRDTHNFEGAYGSYRQAKAAVGDSGTVLRRAIHEDIVEMDAQSDAQSRHSPISTGHANRFESATVDFNPVMRRNLGRHMPLEF